MTARLFVDTNVLVYSFDQREPDKQSRSRFLTAWSLQDRFHLSWWDALIVAAARSAGCSVLLTEDLQHGQDLDGLQVINPFQAPPEDWLSLS